MAKTPDDDAAVSPRQENVGSAGPEHDEQDSHTIRVQASTVRVMETWADVLERLRAT